MEFTNFMTLVREEIEKRVGDTYQVKINGVMKNNGILLQGLTMLQGGSNISPTIYLNNYYEAYEQGLVSMGAVVDDVLDTYERNKINSSVDICSFMNYEKIRNQIIFKLINTEKNRELLEDVPHISFCDLSIVFQCLVSEEMFGNATIMIHNAHMALWNLTVDELYARAAENTPRLHPYEIRSMRDIIRDIASEFGENEIPEQDLAEKTPMYVLSNKMHVHGAASMLYQDILKDFATALGNDMYILPSSIHEVILLPAQGDEDCEGLKQMVREINETQVEPEEVLSDSVYLFDRKTGKIRTI